MEKNKKFNDGGTVLGDGVHTKDGKKGGFFVGNSHANGGIAGINVDTNQPVEVEGLEVIINKKSVSDPKKREFEGEMLTNREILSKINEEGGGVAFEEGGSVDYGCDCDDKMAKGGDVKTFEPSSLIGKMLVGKVRHSEIIDAKDIGNDNIWVTHESFVGGLITEENFTKEEIISMLNGEEVRGDVIRDKKSSKMAKGGDVSSNYIEIQHPFDDNRKSYYSLSDLKVESNNKIADDELLIKSNNFEEVVKKSDWDDLLKSKSINNFPSIGLYKYITLSDGEKKEWHWRAVKNHFSFTQPKNWKIIKGKMSEDPLGLGYDKMAEGGELDAHSELKQFLQEQNTPIVVEEPIIEEIIIEEEIVEAPAEIMLFKEELTNDEDAPMIYVGSSIYANNSNGTDEWIVKSFTKDGVNLMHVPVSPLSHKHDDKHLSFDELKALFNNKTISIKFVLNERELNLILMILKEKLQKTTSFKDGGIVFVDKEGKDDEQIMESQFGNKQF